MSPGATVAVLVISSPPIHDGSIVPLSVITGAVPTGIHDIPSAGRYVQVMVTPAFAGKPPSTRASHPADPLSGSPDGFSTLFTPPGTVSVIVMGLSSAHETDGP